MLALLLLKKYPTLSIDIGYEKDVLIVKIVAKENKNDSWCQKSNDD